MPAPKKFGIYPAAENVDDSLTPISETLGSKDIKIPPHTNTDHITALSPPKVTPKFYPHGQDGPKRKITPILTAPAYTSPQRTRRFGKGDSAFIAEVKLKTPNKKAVEIFDSSKMRAPKLIRPPGLLGSKIEEVNLQETLKVKQTNPAQLKIGPDAKKNDVKVTKSAQNDGQDSKFSPTEVKTDIIKAAKPSIPETKPTVPPISRQISPKPSLSLQQKLQMSELTVLDNVCKSEVAPDNQSVIQPILTSTESSGNRFQTIAISVAGPKVTRTPGTEDFQVDLGQSHGPNASKTSGQSTAGRESSEEQNMGLKTPQASGQSIAGGEAPQPEVSAKNVSAPRQTTVLDDSVSTDVNTTSFLGTSNEALSQTIQENQNETKNSAVSVISVTKSKGMAAKDVGSSSQANETREKESLEKDQKHLDDQKSLSDLSDSYRRRNPDNSETVVTQNKMSEDVTDGAEQSKQMSTFSKTKELKRKTSIQIMSTATEKKRRDSVAYLPTRPTPALTKQRRVSIAANPSIPKRRISIQEQLSTKTEDSTKFSHRLTNFLKENGLAYELEESTVKLEIPIIRISNEAREIHLVPETSLRDAVYSSIPGVTILNDARLDAELLPLLKGAEFGDSVKRKPPLTELIPETQSKDRQKENESSQSIENVVQEMNDNQTDFEIQLQNCQIISKYFDEDNIQLLINKKDIIQAVLNSIRNFQDRQSLQIAACMSLLKIASISESNCETLKECEGLATLNTIFKCYNDNITVQKLILTIWAYMSATESLCQDMLNHGIHTEILEIMSRRSDDPNVIKQSCFILANLVNTEETAKQIMLVGGVHTVINVIEKYHQDPAILENGCRALGSFAAFDETCLDVSQAGATQTVVSILHDTIDNVSVQECSLWALVCLTSIAETCEEVINMDTDEAVLNCLERYPGEENIQEYGVRIMSNLASIESTSNDISNRRVLDILLNMLTNYSTNLCILEHTFVTIGQTVLTFEDQRYLLESGGIKQIITVMDLFNEHCTILEHGCRIIGNMAVFEKLRSQIEYYGASKAVINAMRLLDLVPEIQLCGCMALMNLTANVQTNKLNVIKYGGVSAILSCLDKFTTDSEILLTALKTLTNIISLENACHTIVEKNGVHLLLTLANTTNLESEIYSYLAIILSGLTSLKELEFDIVENIDTTLMRILNLYPNNVDITLAFCQAMENVLVSELGRKMFIYEDRLSLILKYTTQFIYHSYIQHIGCKIIAIIAMDKDNKQVIKPDCIKCLLSSGIIHHDNLQLQILTYGAISCILDSNSDMGRIVLEENGINEIMRSLNTHQTDSRLHVLALMILANLSPSVKKEDSHEILNIVLKTMSQFTENVEIQSYGCHLLCRLSISDDSDQLSRVLNSIRNTLKRHSQKEEVVKSAGEVLYKISQDGHPEEVENILKSPSLPQLPDCFWKSVKRVSVSSS